MDVRDNVVETLLIPAIVSPQVRKRDGKTVQSFDVEKIVVAIRGAWSEVGGVDESRVRVIADSVARTLSQESALDVEAIQDSVEVALMHGRLFDVAKAYIIYRQKRAEARVVRRHPDPIAVSDYIHAGKYARYRPEDKRRELYLETVARVEAMHLRRFGHIAGVPEKIKWAFDMVRQKRLLPSMRSLANDTILPTPSGWKQVGDVQVGDRLFDQDGSPVDVVALQKFVDIELFDVYFSDGSVLRASGDHLWVTSTLDDRIGGKRRTVTTVQIRETLRQRSGNPRYPWKCNHAVWNPAPLVLADVNLPLDPYILGLWLGDGFSHGGQFACHKDDAEIPAAYEAAGFPVTPPSSGNPYTWGTHGLATILREMRLQDNKHIPMPYLRASVQQRLSLLQGLMDSDGHTTSEGRSCFANTSPALLDGVAELLSSLGIKFTTDGPSRKLPHHKDKFEYRFFTMLPVHRLKRKLANLRDDHRAGNSYRTIAAIEPAGRGDATCFHVNSLTHTYLAGPQMIVTHNSMQFGGAAVEQVHNRLYNCSATHLDRLEAFSQGFFLLLCGCGVGYSVQFEHIDKLPEFKFIDETRVVHHVVEDSIEGWADALKALLQSYVDATYVEFAFNKVRREGAVLKTSGGKAPGHLPLKRALERIRAILDEAQGRRLRPVEAHRIMCHVADAVLSGGVRRSAMICLFSLEDSEMMSLKTGKWYEREPWLENANNSVVLKRDEVKKAQFKRIFQSTRQFGEPGFMFVSDKDEVRNPCGEISLNCRLKIDHEVMRILKERAKRGKPMPSVKLGEIYTGVAFCNLTEINAALLRALADFMDVAEAATFIGTLQAAYTDMSYLGWVSEVIAEREALLGVGMTGMMDSPSIALNPDYQCEVATKVVEWNADFASMFGIRSAARATTVKPSGTTSLELGSVGSGHHAHHARRYIRRVTANELESVFQHFKSANPHMCVRKPNGDWVIEFPVEAPEGAVLKQDLTALQFLEMVKSTQLNWVATGTGRPESSPGYVHNVSNTVPVRAEEWEPVSEYLWENREHFSGVTLLSMTGDKDYSFAPFEAITSEADEVRWNQLLAHYRPVDYTALIEEEDNTDVAQEPACAGGACEIPRI